MSGVTWNLKDYGTFQVFSPRNVEIFNDISTHIRKYLNNSYSDYVLTFPATWKKNFLSSTYTNTFHNEVLTLFRRGGSEGGGRKKYQYQRDWQTWVRGECHGNLGLGYLSLRGRSTRGHRKASQQQHVPPPPPLPACRHISMQVWYFNRRPCICNGDKTVLTPNATLPWRCSNN